MLKGMVTKIIDNLQVVINRVHVRMENNDLEDFKCTFSLGATLNQMRFQTTDNLWNKKYVDRTLKEHSDAPLFKLLKIDDFAIYYKVQESMFLQIMDKQR